MENRVLEDQFQWDIRNNGTDEFAQLLCKDLGLDRTFAPQISNEIRQQIFFYRQSIYNGKSYPRDALDTDFVVREEDESENWEPRINTLTEYELEKIHLKELKEEKAKKRRGESKAIIIRSNEPAGLSGGAEGAAGAGGGDVGGFAHAGSLGESSRERRRLERQSAVDLSAGLLDRTKKKTGGYVGGLSSGPRAKGPPADRCVHCGTPKNKTVCMRKGPDPMKRNLCNKCGLAWLTGKLVDISYKYV